MLRRMVFCRFLGMVGSLQMMSVREVGVMSGLFMRIFLMMLGSLVMMACGVLMVLGCLPMVFCSVVFSCSDLLFIKWFFAQHVFDLNLLTATKAHLPKYTSGLRGQGVRTVK